MKIALLHHHARRGGVTQVLRHGAVALRRRGWDVLTIIGEAPDDPWPSEAGAWTIVPGLAYRSHALPGDGDTLQQDLIAATRHQWGTQPDLWHIHNPSLAKNVVLCGVVARLAAEGARLLLHLHDFAEEGRAANLAAARAFHRLLGEGEGDDAFACWLHPSGPGVHRAVLSQRDASRLRRCGFSKERIHHLPNAVPEPPMREKGKEISRDTHLMVAPVRGIRRKNLGELCLLALLGRESGRRIVTTLAPETESARVSYGHWKAYAARLGLPIEFGAVSSGHYPYADLMRRAGQVVTTSVAEGFGFAWLEPWLWGAGVAGRDLPALTDEYRAAGLAFPASYDRLEVPVAWIGEGQLRETWARDLRHAWKASGRRLPGEAVDRLWAVAVTAGGVDFGRLDETLQQKVLERLVQEPKACRALAASLPQRPFDAAFLLSQAEAVRAGYGEEKAGDRLDALCRSLLAQPFLDERTASPRKLLDEFLQPETFSPLLL